MGDRFYSQREGKNGYSKTKVYSSTKGSSKPKRRLKRDIIIHIGDLLGIDPITSMDKMTIAGLEELEKAIKGLK